MKRMVILAECDACNAEGRPATTEGVTTTSKLLVLRHALTGQQVVGRRRTTLDLCFEHEAVLDKVRGLLAEYGRPPSVAPLAVTPGVTAPAAAAAAPSSATAEWECPICAATIRRGHAIEHVWRNHRKGEQRPTGTKCPDCGRKFPNRSGTGAHRVHAHGWDALADALEGAQR